MPKQDESGWGSLVTVGLDVGAGTALGVIVGLWIDRRFNTKPWGTLIGTCVGFAGGMYLMIKELLRANRNQ